MYPNMALRGTALPRECCKAVTFQRIQKGESIEGKKGMFFLIHPWLCCYDSLICICFKVYIFDKLRVNLVQVAVILITTTWTDQVWESRLITSKYLRNSPFVFINLTSLSQDINIQSECVKIWNSLFCTLYLISVLSLAEPTVNFGNQCDLLTDSDWLVLLADNWLICRNIDLDST